MSVCRRPAAAVAILGLMGAATPALAFEANFTWCSGSPVFTLKDVPKGTAKIQLRMRDLQAPSFRHGGGEVAYTGKATIPCGALDSGYVGPSPPSGSHTYVWTIRALGPDGKTLAETSAQRRFPE